MDNTDSPDTARPVRTSSRASRKARSGGGNRVVARRSAMPADVAGERREVEARPVLGDLPEETGLSDEAEMHLRAHRRRARIAEAAYYRAERRGFAPGGEDQDWLEAEAEIDRYGEDVWADERAAPAPG